MPPPKKAKPSGIIPLRQQPAGQGLDLGWDLREVDDSYLVAELIRRGRYPVCVKDCQKFKPKKK